MVNAHKKIINELQNGEKKFRMLIESMPAGFFIHNGRKFIYANEACEKITGYKEDELRKKNFWSIVHPQDRELVKQRGEERLQGTTKAPSHYVLRIITKNKIVKWLDMKATVMQHEGQRVIFGMVVDITEKIKIEQIVEQYKVIVEEAALQIAVADFQGGVKYVNKSWIKEHGYKNLEELLGKNLVIFHPGKELARVKEFNKKLIKFGENSGEIEHQRKDGTAYPTLMHNYILRIKGNEPLLVGMAMDITEQKRIEEELKKSEEKYHTLAEKSRDGIAIVAADGTMKYVNPFLANLLGYEEKEMIGQNVLKFTHPDFHDATLKIMGKFKKGVTDFRFEAADITKDGRRVDIEDIVSEINYEGRKCGLVLVRDITERKKMEAKLHEEEERYRGIFETSRDAIMILEPPTWNFTSGNLLTIKMFRASNEAEFLSYPPWKLSPKLQPDGSASEEKAKKMIELAMAKGSNLFEWTHKRINGEEFFAEVFLSRIKLDKKTFLQAVVRDITERKKIDVLLQENEEILSETGAMAKIGGWKIDLKNQTLAWTKEIYKIHEVSPDFRPTVATAINFYDEESKPIIQKVVDEAIKNGKPFDVELGVITAKGNHLCVRSLGYVKTDEQGRPITVFGTFQDITERKELESELKSRVNDLERMNKAMIGRELKMVELKKEVEKLKNQGAVPIIH